MFAQAVCLQAGLTHPVEAGLTHPEEDRLPASIWHSMNQYTASI